jgi:hypothetical protein
MEEEQTRRIQQRLAQTKPQAEEEIPAPPAPEPPETPPSLAGVDPATPMVQ